jgi:signal peptidase I
MNKNKCIENLKLVLMTVMLALFINTTIVVNAYVPSGSMEGTIMTGDRIIGSRLSYIFEEPKRGDVIEFRFPDDESKLFTKRIIAIPGDIVDIREGKVYLNNSDIPLDEPYIKEPMINEQDMHFEVPDGAYFCMGDNRNNSFDSRYWNNTYVYRDKILAKVIVKYSPTVKLIE